MDSKEPSARPPTREFLIKGLMLGGGLTAGAVIAFFLVPRLVAMTGVFGGKDAHPPQAAHAAASPRPSGAPLAHAPEPAQVSGAAENPFAPVTPPNEGPFRKGLRLYTGLFSSVQRKMDALYRSETENRRLRLENAYLRLQTETKKFECVSKIAATRTQELKMTLSQETDYSIGRTLASINYKPPTHLLPSNLYNLGLSYFTSGQAEDTEKAAVIFTLLTNLEGNDIYKNGRNYLLTGIAWYRLDNLALAGDYFDRVLKTPKGAENEQQHAQARLWRGIIAERTFKHAQSQNWLRELLDNHPHSVEAKWVNILDENNADN